MLLHAVHTTPVNLIRKESGVEFIVLHNNDMHARFEQTSQFSTACQPDEAFHNRCYGGFARVSALVKKYRQTADNGGPRVLFLNAGDTYTGTPWFTIYKDKIVTAFLNVLKPDAIVSGTAWHGNRSEWATQTVKRISRSQSLGNHELDLGVSGLLPMLNNVTFPVLIANLNNSDDHPLYQTRALKKSVVFDINGHKVGVIGYLTPETKEFAQANDLEFKDEVIGIK